jgi:hypothetical protein
MAARPVKPCRDVGVMTALPVLTTVGSVIAVTM